MLITLSELSPNFAMKSKKVKESKNYFKKKSELLHKTVLKLLEFISEEHNIPNKTLNELYVNWINKKTSKD